MRVPLLDLGNVVVQVDFSPFTQWLAEKDGDEEKAKRLLGSSLFFDFEFGNISKDEFFHRVSKMFQLNVNQAEFESKFCAIFPGIVPGMEAVISELAEKSPIYCLSNTNEVHLEYCRERFPILAKFTKIFASHQIHRRKPYPGIYRDVAKDLAIDPRILVFFDDIQANVHGAHRAGLEAYLFENEEHIRTILLKENNKVADNGAGGESDENAE